MILVNELVKYKTSNNEKIVNDLIECINEENIDSLDKLSILEDNYFTMDNKLLNTKQRIKYCIMMYDRAYYDYDGLSLEELNILKSLKDEIKSDISDNDKILRIIRYNSLTNRDIMFFKEAYEYIVNGLL